MSARVLVLGGTGTVGRHTVTCLQQRGARVRTLSRRGEQVAPGTQPFQGDVATGAGLEAALNGVDVVVDASNITTLNAKKSVEFFRQSVRNLHRIGGQTGLQHIVALSIVGIDGATSGYYLGKLEHETKVLGGYIPGTVLRATQFHEFAAQIVGRSTVGPFVLVPGMPVQPIAAATVGEELARLALASPAGRARDIAGPLREDLVTLVRRHLAAAGIRKKVLTLRMPGRDGKAMREGSLLAPSGAKLLGPTYTEWLEGRQAA
ncbi:SDR family oxidoreductase [Streptomyces werraensis]|uniref:SDR family oxidoreductase n=1 Tax=Streptomyces werraensis TaxID=68284 RepID=UPI001CE35D2F